MMICRQRLIVLFLLVEHMLLGGFHVDKEPEDQDCVVKSVFPTALRFEAGYWGSHLDSRLCRAMAVQLLQPHAKNPGKVLSVCREDCGGMGVSNIVFAVAIHPSEQTNKSKPHISDRK